VNDTKLADESRKNRIKSSRDDLMLEVIQCTVLGRHTLDGGWGHGTSTEVRTQDEVVIHVRSRTGDGDEWGGKLRQNKTGI
jgi:hypothetical protein